MGKGEKMLVVRISSISHSVFFFFFVPPPFEAFPNYHLQMLFILTDNFFVLLKVMLYLQNLQSMLSSDMEWY